MEHQLEGVDFLLQRGSGLLAFEQGLGKTLVAIRAFQHLHAEERAERLLVVCPNSLKRNWAGELTKFAPELAWTIVEGAARVRRRLFAEVRTPVVITSYETARTEVTALLALLGRAATVLVLDESHATKNRRSLTSNAARQLAPRTPFRWLLSGTPVTNSPADLHTQIGIVEPTERHPLGSLDAFVADAASGRPGAAAHAAHLADPFVLRRTKEQCLDLPEKLFVDRVVELPPWQRKLYDDMRDRMVCELREMDGEQYRAFASTALVRLTRLSQLASNPKLLLPGAKRQPGKMTELEALVREVTAETGRKVIVWSMYVESIREMVSRFADLGALPLYGAVDPPTRQVTANRFQTDSDVRVLVANPAAAGTGFTLTAASYTIYESLSWRYDYYAQSQDRNHRIGQVLPVTYIRLIAADTIDEAIVHALHRKAGMARTLLGDTGSEPKLSELSRDEMCTLLLENRLPEQVDD